MGNSIPTQLRFPAIAGFTVRADFEGGALSSDFGAHLLPALCQRKPLHGASEQQQMPRSRPVHEVLGIIGATPQFTSVIPVCINV